VAQALLRIPRLAGSALAGTIRPCRSATVRDGAAVSNLGVGVELAQFDDALRFGGTILISENSTAPSAAPTTTITIIGHRPRVTRAGYATRRRRTGRQRRDDALLHRVDLLAARGRNGVRGFAVASLYQANDVANSPITTGTRSDSQPATWGRQVGGTHRERRHSQNNRASATASTCLSRPAVILRRRSALTAHNRQVRSTPTKSAGTNVHLQRRDDQIGREWFSCSADPAA
jgi:hypothetical protein